MIKKILNILKIIAIFCVLITALLFIFLITDIFTATELKEGLLKMAQATGIIAVASIAVILIMGASKNKA